MKDVIDFIWTALSKEIESRQDGQNQLSVLTERAGQAFAFPTSTLANAPLAADGMATFAVRYISDGRKSGEGAGAGTGLPAWYDASSDSWLTFYDNSTVLT